MKSRLVHKAKEHVTELYLPNIAENLSEINSWIDFLLEKNRYFCKYQEVYSPIPGAKISDTDYHLRKHRGATSALRSLGISCG